MKRTALTICLVILAAAPLAFAADLNQKTVAEIVEKAKAGKRVFEEAGYPADQTQVVNFYQKWPGVMISYYIDMRAKLCFYGTVQGNTTSELKTIPCKSLKDGYPLIAPIIDWEK